MNQVRKDVIDAWGAAACNAEETIDLIVSTLIAKVEADKARVRIEHDNTKQEYLAGNYRTTLGLTKRECENRLSKMTGEILGYEGALRTLYQAIAQD